MRTIVKTKAVEGDLSDATALAQQITDEGGDVFQILVWKGKYMIAYKIRDQWDERENMDSQREKQWNEMCPRLDYPGRI